MFHLVFGPKHSIALTNAISKASSTLRRRNLETQLYILQLGLPCTLISQENGDFRKRASNRSNMNVLTENNLKTELFDNDDVMIIT